MSEGQSGREQDAERQRGAALRTLVAWTTPFTAVWAVVALWARPEMAQRTLAHAGVIIVLGVLCDRLAARGRVRLASIALVCVVLGLVLRAAATSQGGVRSPAYAACAAVIVVTGALLGNRGAMVVACCCAAAGGVLVWLEQHHALPTTAAAHTALSAWITLCLIFGTVAVVQLLFARIASSSVERAQREAESRLLAERASDVALRRSEESEERYRRIFQSAAVALFELDLSSVLSWGRARVAAGAPPLSLENTAEIDELLKRMRIVDVNEAAIRMMDAKSKGELTDAPLNATPPRTRAAIAVLTAAAAELPPRMQQEVEVETLQGRSKRLLVDLRLPKPNGDWSRIVASVVDVTELRRLEERTRTAERLESIGRLAGGVAHDFNNALAVIMSWSSMLQKPGRSDAQREVGLQAISQSASRAADLTRQLLSIGRRDVRAPQPTDVHGLIEETVLALRRLLPADIELRVHHGTSEPAMVDAGQLQQVLLNLALNARDAMPGGGVLELRTRLCEAGEIEDLPRVRQIEICVRDNGVGMDEATRARIFDPFFTTKSDGAGTGLGLSTAHAVVTQSGGKIAVETAPNKGSSFYVYLPHAPESSARSTPRMPEVRPQPGRTVLLVEDEALVRDVMTRALREAGYRVLEAGTGDEALRLSSGSDAAIDLLCTDGILPGLPTLELITRLHERFEAIPVLVCSGHLPEELMRRRIAEGSFAFLAKPFRPEELVGRVAELLAPAVSVEKPASEVGAER